jgi:hypothetical protein
LTERGAIQSQILGETGEDAHLADVLAEIVDVMDGD